MKPSLQRLMRHGDGLNSWLVKVHAEKAPFLTERLRIVVLPTLALIKNGKVDDYVVGFDELGGTDDFETQLLEERLARHTLMYSTLTSLQKLVSRSGVIFAEPTAAPAATKKLSVSKGLTFQKTASDEDSDFDD